MRCVCVDCGGRIGGSSVARCRPCYNIAQRSGLSVQRVEVFDQLSDWRANPDGTRSRFIGDLAAMECGQ